MQGIRRDVYDLLVLGGGTGGLVSAQIAAAAGASVVLVERDRPGGDCLWTGCVPSKSLIAAADAAHSARSASILGLDVTLAPVDLAAVMDRVHRVIAEIEPHDSAERLRQAGVEVVLGDGTFTGPHELIAAGRRLRFRAAIIATGAGPVVPPFATTRDPAVVTSDSVWHLRALPGNLVVLGGGPIGCELGQAFARLGSHVTLVDTADRLLPKDEPEAAQLIATHLQADGVTLLLRHHARVISNDEDGHRSLAVEGPDGTRNLPFDCLLIAAGRRARTTGLGLAPLGVRVDVDGTIATSNDLRTTARHVFAVGDVTGRLPFTHVAAHHARVATVNALFGTRRKVDPVIPWATFTRPEVAHVGLTLEQARVVHGEDVVVARSEAKTLDRALTDAHATGFSLLIGDRKGRLIGATVVGAAAGEVIAELTARVASGNRIDALSTTVHAYPTMAEGPSRAADDVIREKYARLLPRCASRAAIRLRRLLPP